MHRLLGAVHEAAVQLSKLPVGDVPAALFKVRQPLSEEAHIGDSVVDLRQHVLQVLG